MYFFVVVYSSHLVLDFQKNSSHQRDFVSELVPRFTFLMHFTNCEFKFSIRSVVVNERPNISDRPSRCNVNVSSKLSSNEFAALLFILFNSSMISKRFSLQFQIPVHHMTFDVCL